MVFTQRQAEGLRHRLPPYVHVDFAMTYGKPSVAESIAALKSKGVGRLIVLPLYPQYAGSSTGAALDKVWQELLQQRNQMSVCSISRFYRHPEYIKALANQIRRYRAEHGAGDKLMFSFHGIPQRQHDLGDPIHTNAKKPPVWLPNSWVCVNKITSSRSKANLVKPNGLHRPRKTCLPSCPKNTA